MEHKEGGGGNTKRGGRKERKNKRGDPPAGRVPPRGGDPAKQLTKSPLHCSWGDFVSCAQDLPEGARVARPEP